MIKPKFSDKLGNYTLTWEDPVLQMQLNRLREAHEHVTGELLIRRDLPDIKTHIHRSRFNLTSTSARDSLEKALTKRVNTVPWGDYLEIMCELVLESYRQGEPLVTLTGNLPRPETKYLIDPILLKNSPNILYGEGDNGKSTIATFLAVLMDTPQNHAGFVPEPGNVLYLDYEADQNELDTRIGMIRRGLGYDTDSDILYRHCSQPLVNEVEEIQGIIAKHKIDLLIVDSMGGACGIDSREPNAMILTYFNALRSLKVTSLTIDHVNKEGGLYGGIYKYNRARSIFEMKKTQVVGEDKLCVGLFHRKMNTGKLINPIGLELQFSEDTVEVSRIDVANVEGLEQELHLNQRIAHLLKGGAMVPATLAELLETPGAKKITLATVKTTLYRNRGKFVKVGSAWGLRAPDSVTIN